MQARYYDPVIGRFYSNDPVGFKNVHNFNRYTYANNNPYKYTDPDGRDASLVAKPAWLADPSDLVAAPKPMDVNQMAINNGIGLLMGLRGSRVLAGRLNLNVSGQLKNSKVWSLSATGRGSVIESQLARTEYKDWFNVGQLNNGKFPLVDFQKGNTLVSLKTVDTTGKTWMGRMQKHIQDLGSNGATVNGRPANMGLDIRVQPGGMNAATPLISYGKQNGVTVTIKEF